MKQKQITININNNLGRIASRTRARTICMGEVDR